MAANGFVHLRVHSEFSLVDGIVRLPDLIAHARVREMPAVALTDLCNLFGAVKFYRHAVAAGIKPIIGADVTLYEAEDAAKTYRLTLLCQNTFGYRNLSRLLTRAYIDGQRSGKPTLDRKWLADYTSGLIALSGAEAGEIGQSLISGNTEKAKEQLDFYRSIFDDRFYLELQRSGQPFQEEYNHAAVHLAISSGTPLVATNPVVFLSKSDFDAHEIRVCIQEGRVLTDNRRPKRFTPEQYFRSTDEMQELFKDIPEALTNTVQIAKRCNLQFQFGKYYLPAFPVPEKKSIDLYLREQSESGLHHRLNRLTSVDETQHAQYAERLDAELEVIISMGFSGYFLIVADFIHWARSNDIPVGPGRGSGTGFLVAFALGITALDPIKYDLLFERFLNPERVSLPDFDIDFCMERRDEVIAYVTSRYGSDKVSQIITHGTMAARAVVRDVGRVMDHPYGYVDKLAKLIPFEIGMTLERALQVEPLLRQRYESEEDVRELMDMARKLEGLARNAGKHAGGVVIAPSALTDFMPLYCEPGGKQFVTQLDKDDVEKLGLVKFDFLGLRTLTIIDKAVKMVNEYRATQGMNAIDIDQVPIDDQKTFAVLKSCRTTAMFQLESRGMKDLIQRLQPDNFEEIIALVALFRPGPLQSGMVDDFIKRKHGRSSIRYPHPSLESILKPTYGVILYQEQVMHIAQVLAGYTLGRADLLRRAMGKKKPEEMARLRQGFIDGAKERGVGERLASQIFDQIEKFAGYGFNRSHSAAYALLAYQTAWLKTHYPAAFMASVLSADMDHTDKVVTMLAECRDLKIEVKPPDINQCKHVFAPLNESTILYGLGAIKGIGHSAIEAILEARSVKSFQDLFDLCHRVDSRRVNRRVLESLIRAGALDCLNSNRAALIASLTDALTAAEQHGRAIQAGQSDMFGAHHSLARAVPLKEIPEWSDETRLEGEKETLGLYLTGHPIERYVSELSQMVDACIAELKPTKDRSVVVAGLVVSVRAMQTRRGDRMAFVTLDDRTGRIELAVFADLYEKYREVISKDKLLIVEGHVSVDEYTGGFRMSAEQVFDIEQAREAYSPKLCLSLNSVSMNPATIDRLRRLLSDAQAGTSRVSIYYHNKDAEAEIQFGQEWRLALSTRLIDRLKQLLGESYVCIQYRRQAVTLGSEGTAGAISTIASSTSTHKSPQSAKASPSTAISGLASRSA